MQLLRSAQPLRHSSSPTLPCDANQKGLLLPPVAGPWHRPALDPLSPLLGSPPWLGHRRLRCGIAQKAARPPCFPPASAVTGVVFKQWDWDRGKPLPQIACLPDALEPRWPAVLDVTLGPYARSPPRRPLPGRFPDHPPKSLPRSRRHSVVMSLLQVPSCWADRGPWGQRPCTQLAPGSAHMWWSISERADKWDAGSPSVQDSLTPRCTWRPTASPP